MYSKTRAVTVDDPHPDEERFVTLGLDVQGSLLVVCWTGRGDDIRIISARPATRHEQRQYEEEG